MYNLFSVADVNNALVDDGLVSKEKIGGSNFFWSFPGKADRLAQIQYQRDVEEVEKLEKEMDVAQSALMEAQKGREDDEVGTRAANLAELASLVQQKTVLQKEYQQLKENDPQALADLEKELQLVTDAAHRWTDNIFNCYSYLTKKKGMEKKQAVRLCYMCVCMTTTILGGNYKSMFSLAHISTFVYHTEPYLTLSF
jgi:hypothetical protein